MSRDAEEPEAVLRRERHALEAPPGDTEDLSDDIGRLVLGDAAAHVTGDLAVVGVVERLETDYGLQLLGRLTHQRPPGDASQPYMAGTTPKPSTNFEGASRS